MSKKNTKKNKTTKPYEKEVKSGKAPLSNKKKILKNIGLGIFLTIGTVIIIAASFVIYAFFASNDIDNTKPVNNQQEFIELYEQNEFERDLPDKLIITEKSLWIDTSAHTYTITLGLKCSAEYERQLLLQLFYPVEFSEGKRNLKNPFISIDENDGFVLSDNIERFSVTGTYSKDTDIEILKETLSDIYMEVKLGHEIGRVILPLDIYTE